jgi:hypothetical protein
MLDNFIKLKVSVHNASKTLVPLTYIRLEHTWVNGNTCAQLLERILRKNGHEHIANQLSECEMVFKCFRIIGIQNSFVGKDIRSLRTCNWVFRVERSSVGH